MTSVIELKERNKANRLALRKLEAQVISLEKFSFHPADLQNAAISIIPAPFECQNGKPEFTPSFFAPYPSDLLMAPKDGWVPFEFPKYDSERAQRRHETPIDRARQLCYYLEQSLSGYRSRRPEVQYPVFLISGWRYQDIGKYGFKKDLWEYGLQIGMGDSKCPPQWTVDAVYHYHDTKFPHLKSMMISDVDGDNETLFRGELLALIRMIRGRLETKKFARSPVHPVLLFSMMGTQHARILQAHFNGTELVIHHSKLYDFRYEDAVLLELFAQWFISSPVGETGPE
ncbi:hypothetical protein DTO169E5_1845 [Paecilomyces variotii]|nr:hypothetical protein DTO169E5_1845 [Paecilomyces variotii]KAJ9378967.1 hypothetical protein DTO063F5_7412 [Paecilomyces variotii]